MSLSFILDAFVCGEIVVRKGWVPFNTLFRSRLDDVVDPVPFHFSSPVAVETVFTIMMRLPICISRSLSATRAATFSVSLSTPIPLLFQFDSIKSTPPVRQHFFPNYSFSRSIVIHAQQPPFAGSRESLNNLTLPNDHLVTVVSTSNTEKLNMICKQILDEHKGFQKTPAGFDATWNHYGPIPATLKISFDSKSYIFEVDAGRRDRLPACLTSVFSSDAFLFVGVNLDRDFSKLEEHYDLPKLLVPYKNIVHEIKERGYHLPSYAFTSLCREFINKGLQKLYRPAASVVYRSKESRGKIDYDIANSYAALQVYHAVISSTDPRYQRPLRRKDLPESAKLLLFDPTKTVCVASGVYTHHPVACKRVLDRYIPGPKRVIVKVDQVYQQYERWGELKTSDYLLWDIDLVIVHDEASESWRVRYDRRFQSSSVPEDHYLRLTMA
ncbi:hypothetical protein HDV05_000172 [Chytridiales sp. JEL 0842]|nr:hypothetical protein HDV05_000172 [Chytridiales sp. JEL 0842]